MKKSILALSLMNLSVFAANFTSADLGGLGRTYNANALGQGSFTLGADFRADYGSDALIVNGNNKKNVFGLTEEVFTGYGIYDWADISASFPLYQEAVTDFQNDLTGWGDLSTTLRLAHPYSEKTSAFKLAYLLRLTYPTGADHHGYFPREATNGTVDTLLNFSSVTSAAGYKLNPMLAWTLDLSKVYPNNPWRVHTNLGIDVNVHRPHTRNFQDQFTSWMARFQTEYVYSEKTSYFGEFYGQSRLKNLLKGFDVNSLFDNSFLNDQFSVEVGAKHKYANGWNAGLALNASLVHREAKMQWQVVREGQTMIYNTETAPQFGASLTIGFGSKGAKAFESLKEAEVLPVHDTVTVTVTKYDTVKVIEKSLQRDTVIINKVDTLKVFQTQAPDKVIPMGQSTFRNVTFFTGKSEIRPTSFPILDNVVQSLKNFPDVQLEIVGHTDNQGNAAKNQVLSEERAKAVLNYLVSKGIQASRLKSAGMGQTKPVAENTTESNREINRRVEFNRIK